ncbi:hypothetical protein [Haloplanus sp. C73]|uniref:hypothetical protein n=1 Tax=Haloplanus sp. C73 TaxID=3421641 RepID=UPI003EB9B63C
MEDDRIGRRTLLGASAGLLASLSGCSGLFIEETATPGGTSTPTATPRPTATTTATATRRRSPTETEAPAASDDVEVDNRGFVIELDRLEKYATVVYRFDVENTSDRVIRDVEFRVRVRYEHEDYARIVATDYPRFWFDTGDDDDGLGTGSTERVRNDVRFERDGRAQESTDSDRFSLELTVRRVRFV